MPAASVLDGKTAINVSGNVSAGDSPANFTIKGSPSDVANYARQGNDLIIEMKNGQTFTIKNFSAQGMNFNNLVFVQGETVSTVGFGSAAANVGDGIIDAFVTTQVVGAGISTAALLGILSTAGAVGAVAIGASGNGSGQAGSPVDPTAPAAPTALSISHDTGTSETDGITNVKTQHFVGKAEAGSKVELFLNDVSIGTVTADAEGKWSFDHTATALADGSYVLTAKATDAAGNVSPESASYEFTVDTQIGPMSYPEISDDSGLRDTDHITSDNALVFSGIAHQGSVVEVFINDVSVGTATTAVDGAWSFDYTHTTLADGTYSLRTNVTDVAGNSLQTTSVFIVDTVAPDMALPITLVDSAGNPLANDQTTMLQPILSGVANEGNVTIEFSLGGNVIGTTTADESGNWTFTFTGSDLSVGSHVVTASITDLAGNTSTGTDYAFNVVAPVQFGATITGDGGNGGLVTFAFDEDVNRASLNTSGIVVANGTMVAGSLIWVDDRTFTIEVEHDITIAHTNVAVTLLANSVSTIAGEVNGVAKNATTLDSLFSIHTLSDDITGWDTSHAISASGTFSYAGTFNQDIGDWDMAAVTNTSFMFNGASAFNQDLGDWNTSAATNMMAMFQGATAFNGNIGNWDVSSVATFYFMFNQATSFDQDLGGWDISSLTNAGNMFTLAGMSAANMDATIRGWAKLDTAAGETAIQESVFWTVTTYTDSTAVEYLRSEYDWFVDGTIASNVIEGDSGGNTLGSIMDLTGQVIHGLAGDDQIYGGSGDDWLVGGAGNDMIFGGGGADTFHYGFKNAGSDIIADFNAAQGDVIHLADLLVGYNAQSSTLSDFITAETNGSTGTILKVDFDGSGASTDLVQIELQGVAYTSTLLDDFIASGNVLPSLIG